MRGEKMSKSIGNVVRVPEALEMAPGEAVRLYLLSTHYRQPADFNEEGLLEAKRTLDRLYGALERVSPTDFGTPHPIALEALIDDLNTPKVVAILHELLGELNRSRALKAAADLRATAGLLGLLDSRPSQWLKGEVIAATTASMNLSAHDPSVLISLPNDEIETLVVTRKQKRAERDFAGADQIRSNLLKQGVILEDRPDGTTDWRRA
jgi:cysteinyl-tRNA synthetase